MTGMNASGESKNKRPVKAVHRGWHFAIVATLFVLAISLQFIFEHSEEVIENVPMPHLIQRGILQAGSWFSSPFAFIPRPLEARYSALVSISDHSEGSLPGPCIKRSFLAKLLPAINVARPAMIVLDIALPADEATDSCGKDAQATKGSRASG